MTFLKICRHKDLHRVAAGINILLMGERESHGFLRTINYFSIDFISLCDFNVVVQFMI